MKDPPKRFESELTVVIDRSKLPPRESPVSAVPGPTIEQLSDIARARRDLEDAVDTMVPCPCCAACALCRGLHMVTPAAAAAHVDPPDDVA